MRDNDIRQVTDNLISCPGENNLGQYAAICNECMVIYYTYGPMAALVGLHIALPHYYDYTNVSENIELLNCLPDTFCRVCV